MTRDQEQAVVKALMECVPHLELRISEHNDGVRLHRRVCELLGELGYPGWLDTRFPLPLAGAAIVEPVRQQSFQYYKVRQG